LKNKNKILIKYFFQKIIFRIKVSKTKIFCKKGSTHFSQSQPTSTNFNLSYDSYQNKTHFSPLHPISLIYTPYLPPKQRSPCEARCADVEKPYIGFLLAWISAQSTVQTSLCRFCTETLIGGMAKKQLMG